MATFRSEFVANLALVPNASPADPHNRIGSTFTKPAPVRPVRVSRRASAFPAVQVFALVLCASIAAAVLTACGV